MITCSTPNGKKVQILLEELKDVYSLEWTTSLIDIDTDEQKQPWFLRLNPNGKYLTLKVEMMHVVSYHGVLAGRIPIIIDNTSGQPFPVMESSAELLYLVDQFDKENHFTFSDAKERSQLYQWLFFWHASGQPNQAQLNHFGRFAPVHIPCKHACSIGTWSAD